MKVAQGESKAFLIDIDDGAGAPLPLAGKRVYVTLSQRGQVKLEKANTDGGGSNDEIEVVQDGQVRLKLASEETAALSAETLFGETWVAEGASAKTMTGRFQIHIEQAKRTTFPTAP